MGIYIKGMEMPKSFINVRIYSDGRVVSQSISKFGEQIATAIPFPPHGRLIDADAFFKDICDSLNEMTAIGIAVDGEWMWGKLNDALNNAPTIIEAEEGE